MCRKETFVEFLSTFITEYHLDESLMGFFSIYYRFIGSPLSSAYVRRIMKSKPMVRVYCQPMESCYTQSVTSQNIVHSIPRKQLFNHTKIKNINPSTTSLKASMMPRRNSVDGSQTCHVHLRFASIHTLSASRFLIPLRS